MTMKILPKNLLQFMKTRMICTKSGKQRLKHRKTEEKSQEKTEIFWDFCRWLRENEIRRQTISNSRNAQISPSKPIALRKRK